MIPAAVGMGAVSFQVAIDAARPLSQAPATQVAALVAQGQALLQSVDAALVAYGPTLDANEPTGFATGLIAAVNGLASSAEDQRTLSDMRGYLGRAVLNLAQGVV